MIIQAKKKYIDISIYVYICGARTVLLFDLFYMSLFHKHVFVSVERKKWEISSSGNTLVSTRYVFLVCK